MSQKVLSYDLGGTKVAVGVVSSRGRVLEDIRVPVHFERGKKGVLDQLTELGKNFLLRHPEIKKIGIASAGPLDPKRGILLEPTNFSRGGKLWGQVPIASLLRNRLKREIYLENDAAAAVLAERWIGAGKSFKNVMVLTLGTGLGTGIICNGQLVRSGRNLHPEAGHMIIRFGDLDAPCGCGNFGCAEAYLSGKNFERRAQKKLARPNITGSEIANLARKGNPQARALFHEYSEIMAIALYNYVRIFSPELVIFAGSFAATSDLFIKQTHKHLHRMLFRLNKTIHLTPKLTQSNLHNESGLIGGAYVALF